MISSKAGIAACAKNASLEADQTTVAKLLNPRGLKMSVAGNSFIVTKNTKTAPTRTLFLSNGNVTNHSVSMAVFPRFQEDSSIAGLICNAADLMVPSAIGKKRTKYPNINIQKVWYMNLARLAPKKTNAKATTIPGRANPVKLSLSIT